ncbi:unnamed protein product [Lota lota]
MPPRSPSMHWGGPRLVSASASSFYYRHGDHGEIMFREARPELQADDEQRVRGRRGHRATAPQGDGEGCMTGD